MTAEEKIEQIKRELQAMYDDGEVISLLREDLDKDTLRFIAKVKDFYLQQEQKKIIAREDFVI